MIDTKRFKYVPGNPGVTLFDAVADMDNLLLAHENASRGKKWYPEVKMVDSDPIRYCLKIQNMLLGKSYKTSKYDIFYKIEGSKLRKIYKLPYYPDRIVQWALLQIIGPILENTFTIDTYSSLPNRGPLKCAKNVCNAIAHYNNRELYYLKIDIRHFYPSINHDRLKMKYRRLFKDDDLLWLIDEIIDSVGESEGVPIGNYLSQYSGNLYLTAFDHFVKEILHVENYFRYMDDMVFLNISKTYLHYIFNIIKHYLEDIELLTIKSNYQVSCVDTEGLDFVGYIINKDYILMRKRIKKNYVFRMKRFITIPINDHARSSFGSYKGFLQHADTYNLQSKYGLEVAKKWNIRFKLETRKSCI